MEEFTRESRVVIAHAAPGAILLAFRYHHPVVVVPRLRRHEDVFDDHRLQLATALAREGRVRLLEVPAPYSLQEGIDAAAAPTFEVAGPSLLIRAIRRLIDQ